MRQPGGRAGRPAGADELKAVQPETAGPAQHASKQQGLSARQMRWDRGWVLAPCHCCCRCCACAALQFLVSLAAGLTDTCKLATCDPRASQPVYACHCRPPLLSSALPAPAAVLPTQLTMASRQQLPEAAVSAQPAQLQAAPAAPPPPRLPPLAVVQHASSEPSTPLAGMAGAANGVGTSPKSKTAASLDCGGSAATPMSRQGSGAAANAALPIARSSLSCHGSPLRASVPPGALFVSGCYLASLLSLLLRLPGHPVPPRRRRAGAAAGRPLPPALHLVLLQLQLSRPIANEVGMREHGGSSPEWQHPTA